MYAAPIRPHRAVRPSPIFLAVIAVAVAGGVLSWNDSLSVQLGQFGVFLLVAGGWVVSLCLHEFAHAYAAYRAGDREVEAAGYLTLNPFKYAHPLLSIVLPVVFIALGGIGLPGGAVYLHPHAFRSRFQRSVASAVGPLTNVVFAVVLLQVAASQGHVGLSGPFLELGPHGRFWAGIAFLGFLQVSAAVLNLLPVPGLDGYGIIEPYLSPETAFSLNKVKPYGMLGLFVVLFYIPSVNARFFEVIGKLYHLAGGKDDVWSAGYSLFRFWHKLG
jgi:Zn-dependent protease